MLIEKMESAKCTIKEAVQAIQELDFGEDTCNINQYIKKRMQNNDISEIINIVTASLSLEPGLSFRSLYIYIYFTFWSNCF